MHTLCIASCAPMIIIKKADAISYRLGPVDCDCRMRYVAADGMPHCDVTFSVDIHEMPVDQQFFPLLMQTFSRMCEEKSYFIPRFYFRIIDVLLRSPDGVHSLFEELDDEVLKKIHRQLYSSAEPHTWLQEWQQLLPKPSSAF